MYAIDTMIAAWPPEARKDNLDVNKSELSRAEVI